MVIRVPDQRNTPGGYSALDDRLLVLDFQAGNPQAFVEIHRRYGALARHVCQRFLPRQQDADEAFQETMIRVFQGLYRFNGRYALQPWIARIAKNVALDTLRGHARRPRTDDSAPTSDELPVPGDEADEIVERLVQRDTVLSVLADLPETHRRALMLRELDGRSHREVAQEMEITTAQAKALIHRAKGSFRRRWLEKVSDRGGFAAIAFLPLLWAARLGHFVRRFADKAGVAAQTAQVAAPEAVSTTMTATTSAAPAASGVAERVVAAGMTILLAGGVTVGAARIVRGQDHEQPARAAAAAVQLAVEPVSKPAPSRLQEDVPPLKDPRLKRHDLDKDTVHAGPPVQTSEDAPPAEDPPADPTPAPEPSPSPAPEPTPPPAPAFSYAVSASTTSVESCQCSLGSQLVGSQVDPAADGFSFSQSLRGGAQDAGGVATWPFSLLQWGQVSGQAGSLDFRLTLTSGAGKYAYSGTTTLASITKADDGSVAYRFEGTFDLGGAGDPAPGLPGRGFASVTIQVWQDGTIYAGSLALQDATG